MTENGKYKIRTAVPDDLDQAAQVELNCFPAAEAADRAALKARLEAFGESFLVAEADGRIIGFINGAVTDEKTIADKMLEDISLHVPDGAFLSIFGLDVIEEYRHMGVAARLMEAMIETAGKQGRKGLILTCKDRLIGYYEKFGYVNMGVSKSVHGGAVWYDMVLEF